MAHPEAEGVFERPLTAPRSAGDMGMKIDQARQNVFSGGVDDESPVGRSVSPAATETGSNGTSSTIRRSWIMMSIEP